MLWGGDCSHDTVFNMNLPQVSICIPAYNSAAFITETLASVKAQTFTDWEVILTEDGTEDRTEDLVAQFAKTVTQPVVYNRHEINRGLPHTRNTGINAARGQWIAFLDADDFWEPDHLESLIDQTKKAAYDLVFAGSKLFDHESRQTVGVRIPSEEHLRTLPYSLFMGWLSVMPSAVLIRRGTFERFGLVSTEFRRVNDTEYWLRVLRQGGNIGYSGKATCLYRQHADSLTRSAATGQFIDSARLCERYADWDAIPNHSKHSRPANLYRWAANLVMVQDPHKALSLLKQSLRTDPLNAKTWLSFPQAMVRCLSTQRNNSALS
jgi:glycosyltransferase involved in cell wall biosynthesis